MKVKHKMKIGIIGGSGLDKMSMVKILKNKHINTPYGNPSSALILGQLYDHEVVFLARHGSEHTISPSEVPYRANVFALKSEGCGCILATTACGSLNEKMKPGDFVFVDQFLDFTKFRIPTYFEKKVVHTSMADPFDKSTRKLLIQAAEKLKLAHHKSGTIVTIEGPRFSSRAESHMFRKLGADIINMTSMPEVALANELNIPYQSIAMVTDYDCWKIKEEPVTIELVFKRMRENADKVKNLLIETIQNVSS